MNCIYSLPCFCSDSNDILNKFLCLVCNLVPISLCKFKIHKNLLTFASGCLVKFCSFYTRLSLETVFPALKQAQICYIDMNAFFLENWQFKHKLAPPLLHTYQAWNTVLTIGKNMKVSGIQKFQFSNSSELREIWKYSLH